MSSIYEPSLMSPQNETRDMSVNQNFSAQVNGVKITDYQILIKNNNTDSLLYDSSKINLATPLYDKETLEAAVTGGVVANDQECKWTLTYWNGTESVTSGEIFFKAFGTPTVTLAVVSPIVSQSYEFSVTYSHPQNIPIKRYKFILYDSNDVVLEESEYIYSAKLKNTFSGFVNGSTYKVECIVEDQNDVEVSSGIQTFTVSYSEPSLTIVPDATLLSDKSAIEIKWSQAIQVPGNTTGTFSYVSDFITVGNKGLQLDANSTLYYNISIPEDFTVMQKLLLPNGFDGVFMQLENTSTGDIYKIGYENSRFYFDNKGTVYYGLERVLPTSPFLVFVRPTNVVIKTDTFTEKLDA